MTSLHLRGTVLPEGELRDIWVVGGRLTFTRPRDGAVTVVDGGYLLPGLVDAHAHLGHDPATMAFDAGMFTAAALAYAEAGTTLLRVPGHRAPIPAELRADPRLPRLVTAGEWLAWSGLHDLDGPQSAPGDLTAAAVAQARANDGWCKTYGDWEPFTPAVPAGVLRELCTAVHAAGGRVAAHCQTAEGTRNAVLAGVDSIEHAWYLTADLLEVLARRGGAVTPTWSGFLPHVADVRTKPEGPRKDWFLGGVESLRTATVAAHEAGVTVLAGTDSLAFGDVVTEIEHLVAAGLPGAAAVGAASWDARRYLGFPGLSGAGAEGAPADLVAVPDDPRRFPGVLRHPSLVLLSGTTAGTGYR
ncbi:amidohydrolase family protein [Dactylosporangium sp. NPDC005572]|uniref:amidohydrolase family protein n=1 Tax=Dactylosporangium sp. NPDC005572 TaxID=3156889 RepID=UPI0033A50803